VTCRACGGPLSTWRDVAAGEPSDRRTYTLLRCADCGSGLTAWPPPGPEAYEAGAYAPRPPRAQPLVRTLQRAAAGQPVRLLRSAGLPPGARVLDVGAGPGRLVEALGAAGFDARGIEPSMRSAERAQAAGLAVERLGIAEHEDEDLQAVVLWHVIEHLDEPGAALARIREWLAPGALLLVGVPNAASWQATIGGARWLHWDAPRHRVHLTPRGLAELLAHCGFGVERTAHLVWEFNPWSMWMALLSRAGMAPGLPFHLVKRNARLRVRDATVLATLGIPALPAAFALEGLAAAARRGGTIACVARAAA
jgi:SAM-dependent methyltransferase